MLRAQAGRPYCAHLHRPAELPVERPHLASPEGEQRNDNVAVFDMRLAKAFTFGRGMRLRGFLDVYNITNTNAVQDMTVSYGANFLRPSLIQRPADCAHRRAVRVLAETNHGTRLLPVRGARLRA